MYLWIHLFIYELFELFSSVKFEIKLVEVPLKIDFASDKAFLASTFALLVQLANREFFFDLEVHFFGTAMCISFYIILF